MESNKKFSEENKLKQKSGADLAELISNELQRIKTAGIILDFSQDVNVKHPDFPYKKQYLANFVINTLDGKFIIVRSSNSFRQDRIKTGYFDIEGILKHSSFSKDIISSIYLFPDTEFKKSSLINLRKKIIDRVQYSPASNLLSFKEFVSYLENFSYEVLSTKKIEFEKDQLAEDISKMTLEEQGSYYGKLGNAFEKNLVNIMDDYRNLIDYKKERINSTSIFKLILEKLISVKSISRDEIIKISASDSIPLLLNGGKPKTDLFIVIETIDGTLIEETISIKMTTKNLVSCHDYKAKDFIRILNCEKTRLADYFEFFQSEPTQSSFKSSLPKTYSIEEFTELLEEKKHDFVNWVLRGKGDVRNLNYPKTQISNYILFSKGNENVIYEMDEYILKINAKSNKTFGVPFSWTYPSKQRGKRIQLKLPIIM